MHMRLKSQKALLIATIFGILSTLTYVDRAVAGGAGGNQNDRPRSDNCGRTIDGTVRGNCGPQVETNHFSGRSSPEMKVPDYVTLPAHLKIEAQFASDRGQEIHISLVATPVSARFFGRPYDTLYSVVLFKSNHPDLVVTSVKRTQFDGGYVIGLQDTQHSYSANIAAHWADPYKAQRMYSNIYRLAENNFTPVETFRLDEDLSKFSRTETGPGVKVRIREF